MASVVGASCLTLLTNILFMQFSIQCELGVAFLKLEFSTRVV